ncbi:uncharacterized protein LOC8058214 [Sorghum bicolor]|jgi:hypothetical protein|uniref:Uncharacterized protein n=1 Tax=Sorghum bicolor TaxID=4558 RepID=C5XEJ3_SORBI|nr:uncharacterized protein LOC8058214 [Sorghum bicolor]EES01147.1 hypothetical protein SORBI_3003G233300 [Sorghum bicolor]|eukprot:XP_002456027.1 uncharacterized protein LOC8058214 [Sorghum bicolor]
MATPARPYRFPALPEKEEDEQVATRCTRQTCGTCSASAVASCVALCCCPCAVVSCLTLALIKAPYVAGRRCVARIARRRLRKARTRRVRDVDEDDEEDKQQQGPRRSKELWGIDLPRAAVDDGADDGSGRAKVSSRMDVSEKVWADMYQVGLWGFGRLSFSAAVGDRGDSEKDGDSTAPE